MPARRLNLGEKRTLSGVPTRMLGVTVMFVQGVLPMAACLSQAQPFMSFHIPVFYFCISRKYGVSEISCLGLSDMKCLRMYYRGIRLVVNFSLSKVIYCEPLLFLSCLLI